MVQEKINLFTNIFPADDVPRIEVSKELKSLDYLNKIHITDTTLRDGQQGWRVFTVDEGVKIFELLAELSGDGVITSAEFFLYTEKDRKLIRTLMDYDYKYPKIIGWIRATLNDLQLVIESKLSETVILTSISDYHIYYKLGLTRDKAFSKYLSVVEKALSHGIAVRCTLEDVTRADLHGTVIPFIRRLLKFSERFGIPTKIKLADTLGLGLPFPEVPPPRGIPALIRTIREKTNIPPEWIEFHGHNDLGLVVANHLAAWLYGSTASNCTLLGIGERAGNCPLEVMMIHYAGLKGSSGINLKSIKKTAELFTSLGFKIPEFYPLVGENAFRTKAGIHIDGLIKNPSVYLPFNPKSVLGIPYTVSITPYSGRAAIAFWINNYFGLDHDKGIQKNDPRVNAMYNEIVNMFRKSNRSMPLTNEEILQLVRKYFPEIYNKYEHRLRK